jgi:L-threonylcarbamoyladenylate synthase
MTAIILKVDPDAPDPLMLAEGARIVADGRVVAFPTDTFYGLAADVRSAPAIERVFAAKGRAADQALPLVAADRVQVEELVGRLPPAAQALADRFWPGPLTMLVWAPDALAPAVTAGTRRVGIRVPANEVARAFCRICGSALTATSANISGQAPTVDPVEVAEALGDRIGAVIDAGSTPGGPPSTIVDVTGPAPLLVRAGAVDWALVETCLRK